MCCRCLLRVAGCPLFVVRCSLPVVWYSCVLFVMFDYVLCFVFAGCLLDVGGCMVLVVCCLMSVCFCVLLFVVCCLLSAVCCSLLGVSCSDLLLVVGRLLPV